MGRETETQINIIRHRNTNRFTERETNKETKKQRDREEDRVRIGYKICYSKGWQSEGQLCKLVSCQNQILYFFFFHPKALHSANGRVPLLTFHDSLLVPLACPFLCQDEILWNMKNKNSNQKFSQGGGRTGEVPLLLKVPCLSLIPELFEKWSSGR